MFMEFPVCSCNCQGENQTKQGIETFHMSIAISDKAGRGLLFGWWIWKKTEGVGGHHVRTDIVRARVVDDFREAGSSDTTGLLHIGTHGDSQHGQDKMLKINKIPHGEAEGAKSLPSPKSYVQLILGKRKPSSPTECHWGYQPHSRAGPIPRSSWQAQNGLHILCMCVRAHMRVQALSV